MDLRTSSDPEPVAVPGKQEEATEQEMNDVDEVQVETVLNEELKEETPETVENDPSVDQLPTLRNRGRKNRLNRKFFRGQVGQIPEQLSAKVE
jgi:hypothetical protein